MNDLANTMNDMAKNEKKKMLKEPCTKLLNYSLSPNPHSLSEFPPKKVCI